MGRSFQAGVLRARTRRNHRPEAWCHPSKKDVIMTAAAKFPLDLTELSVFRTLKEHLGGKAPTVLYFWFLWRDLAQLSQEGVPLGRMKPANIAAFLSLLVDENIFHNHDQAKIFHGEHLLSTSENPGRLLVTEGEDWVCPRFINLNAELAAKPRESRGGFGRSFALKMKKFENQMMQTGLRLPSDSFIDTATHQPLDPAEVERVQRLVVSCDNALDQTRPPIGWSEGLVALALLVIRKYKDDEIYYICRKIAVNRNHVNLRGMRTETLLPKFSTITSDLGED